MRIRIPLLTLLVACFSVPSAFAQAVQGGPFRVGAAKLDVTPTESELPHGYLGILDHVFARAIVIDNGHTSAALVTVDAGGIPNELWASVSERANKELGIPSANVLIKPNNSASLFNPTFALRDI